MSGGTVSRAFIYKLKIAAMLHDPPDKAWHVMEKRKMGHKEVSERIVGELLPELGKIPVERAGLADFLAAGADRWFSEIFTAVVGGRPEEIVIVNPLSLKSMKPNEPDEDYPKRWVNEINEIKEIIWRSKIPEEDKYKWFYHILYGFGELLYLKHYPNSIGPADTRVPHHTTFDHLSMTASISNWLISGEEPSGFLVQLELAGIQRYIQNSRKLCDLWFSSFFSSYLIWSMVEELVDKIGPDVLISPSCRWNPFYFRWLLRCCRDLSENLAEELRRFLKKLSFENLGEVFSLDEPLPVLPTSVRMILPPLEVLRSLGIAEGGIAEYFLERYRRAYSELVRLVKKECENDEKLREALEKVGDAPPLMLRCAVVRIPDEVGDESKEYVKRFNENLDNLISSLNAERARKLKNILEYKEDKKDIIKIYTFFPFVGLKKLTEKFRMSEKLKAKAPLAADFQAWTEELWRRGDGFNYCTVCGEAPSILDVPRGDRSFGWYFDEGEHLCQFCLIKRLAATRSIRSFLEWTLGTVSRPVIPSVSWQAIYPLLRDFSDEEKCKDVREFLEKKEKEIDKMDIDETDREHAKEALTLLRGEFEKDGTLHSFAGGGVDAIRELQRLLGPEKTEALLSADIGGKYFTLVQADADNIGSLLGGRFEKVRGIPSNEDFFVELVKKTGNYKKEDLDTFREIVGKLLRAMKEKHKPEESSQSRGSEKDDGEKEIRKLWPSFISSISRTLMLSALRDAQVARAIAPAGTTLVYAGGDDLMAIVPVPYTLQLIRETRRYFGEGDCETFTKIRLDDEEIAFLPTMGNCSRSYAAIIAHFKSPLSLALTEARDGLEAAKNAETAFPHCTFEKDSLFLEYRSRGGAGANTVLPLSPEGLEYLRIAEELLDLIERGKLSNSLIRDLMEICDRYDHVMSLGPQEIVSIVFNVLKRNVKGDKAPPTTILPGDRVLTAVRTRMREKSVGDKSSAQRFARAIGSTREEHSLLWAISRALYISSVGRRGRE